MNTTPPTQAEADDPLVQLLPRDTPYGITGVRHTQFSVARHYGGITYNGHMYAYFPEQDQLWRHDVLCAVAKIRKAKAKEERAAAKAQAKAAQGTLV